MTTINIIADANITCPNCGFTRAEEMPEDSCQYFYECTQCRTILRPKADDCCVFCSYADRQCPSKQLDANE